LIARFGAMGVGLGTSVLTARVLGPSGRGTYYVAIMLAALATQFGNLGLHAANTWLAAREPKLVGRLAGNSVWISVVLGCVAGGAVSLIARLGGSGNAASDVQLGAIATLSVAMLLLLLIGNLLAGMARTAWYCILQVAAGTAGLAAAAFTAVVSGGVTEILWLTASLTLLVLFFMLVAINRVSPIPWRFDVPLVRRGLGYALRAFIVSLLGFLVTRSSLFILGSIRDSAEVGHFSIASQLFDVFGNVPASIALMLFPHIVRTNSGWSETQRAALWFGLGAAIMTVLLWPLLPRLITALFGASFAPSVPVARAVLPAVVFYGMTSVLSQYPAANGMPHSLVFVWLLLFVVACASSWVFATRWGGLGAAAAMSVTYLIATVAMLLLGNRLARTRDISPYGLTI
jgi:O-antigen/teichoic acid export membrane protein